MNAMRVKRVRMLKRNMRGGDSFCLWVGSGGVGVRLVGGMLVASCLDGVACVR